MSSLNCPPYSVLKHRERQAGGRNLGRPCSGTRVAGQWLGHRESLPRGGKDCFTSEAGHPELAHQPLARA